MLDGKADAFLDVESRVLDPQLPHSVIPKGCYLVSPAEEIRLRPFLLRRGLCSFILESDVAVDGDGYIRLAGLFGVHHKKGLRLLLDRRPQNFGVRLGWARLPNGSQFIRVLLLPGWGLRGSGEDHHSCFFQCRNARRARYRNAFGRAIDGSDVLEFGGVPGETYRLCLDVVVMGDTSSVDVIQALHGDILQKFGVVDREDLMVYKHPIPESGLMTGIYIDDLVTVLIARDCQLSRGPHFDRDLRHRAHAAYIASDLQRAPDKAFGWGKEGSTRGDSSFTAWGTRVTSNPGTAAAPPGKRLLLALLIWHLATQRLMPKKLVVVVLGLLVHPMMHRRTLSASLHRVYKYIAPFGDFDIIKVPFDVRQELCYAAILMPFAFADLRSQIEIDPILSATDATPMQRGFNTCHG